VYTFRLGYRPPYNWASIIGFLGPRAIPGVETITLEGYRRAISLEGNAGFISVRPVFAKNHLELQIEFPEPAALFRIVERVRNIFDLRADPTDVDSHLHRDPHLRPIVNAHGGMRVPGCWDGFEIAVRAILGQQVSVKGATTMAGRLVAAYGAKIGDARIFPAAAALAEADLTSIGLTKQRAHSIRELASAVARGEVSFDASLGLETFEETMTKLPGIGAWTAQYIAMRIGEPDAFPTGDLYLRKFAKESEAWRPWRAYAAMYIWNGSQTI
jgi:AraC family transcriptional regulator of adaptative response / DNA-3-methyladenine glycosylase II